jgi:hypothetical protein
LGAPGLFTPAKKEELITRTNKALYHYPRHFFPKHMKKLSNGKWKLDWSKRTIKSTRIWRIECMHFHLPATLPEIFLDETHFAMCSRPQDRWKDGTTPAPLPHWIEKL